MSNGQLKGKSLIAEGFVREMQEKLSEIQVKYDQSQKELKVARERIAELDLEVRQKHAYSCLLQEHRNDLELDAACMVVELAALIHESEA